MNLLREEFEKEQANGPMDPIFVNDYIIRLKDGIQRMIVLFDDSKIAAEDLILQIKSDFNF
jgi:hypothetical protein